MSLEDEFQKLSIVQIEKPIIKWVGGKTQIINQIINKILSISNNIEEYHEMFVGGGSVLLAVLSYLKSNKIKIKKINAYDINVALIHTYINIRDKCDEVKKHLDYYLDEYTNITGTIINRKPKDDEAKTSRESYYYWMRKKFNDIDKTMPECSALFLIINKTCFRGVYREGPNGFNVPFGHYKTVPSFNLPSFSKMVQDVNFQVMDFRETFKLVKKDDFIYIDPPYYPENEKSFVKYNVSGFDKKSHDDLFKLIKDCESKFLMSNSNTAHITEYFKGFNIEKIECRRSINSKDPSSKIMEVLVFKIE